MMDIQEESESEERRQYNDSSRDRVDALEDGEGHKPRNRGNHWKKLAGKKSRKQTFPLLERSQGSRLSPWRPQKESVLLTLFKVRETEFELLTSKQL